MKSIEPDEAVLVINADGLEDNLNNDEPADGKDDKLIKSSNTTIEVPPISCCCRYVVEPALFFYVMFGIMLRPLTSQYIYAKVAEGLGSNYTNLSSNNHAKLGCNSSVNDSYYSRREFVQNQTSQFNIYQALVGMIPLTLMSMIYGAYSDRVGRKFLMVLAICGSICTSLIYIITIKFNLPIYTLFAVPFSDSFLGNTMAFTMASCAFMADTCSPNERGFRMTVIDVCFLFGEGVANLVTGYMINLLGFFWAFLFSAVGSTMVLVYVLLFIPNTYPTFAKKQNLCSYISSTTRVYTKSTPSGRRWKLFLLAWTYIIVRLGRTTDIRTLFELNAPLCWSSVYIGIFHAIYSVILGIGALFGARVLNRHLSYAWIAVVGYVSGALEYLYLPIVQSTLMMMFVPVLGTLHVLPMPMIRTIMSILVNPEEQGYSI